MTQTHSKRLSRAVVTESTILSEDGTTHTVTQLGGSAGGLRTIVSHGHTQLAPGDIVELAVTNKRDLAGRTHTVPEKIAVVGQDQRFVRTRTTTSKAAVYWASGCVLIEYKNGGTTHIDGSDEIKIISDVLGEWTDTTANCSYMNLMLEGATEREAGIDTHNVIYFREGKWCRPASEDMPELCHAKTAAGIAFVTAVDNAESDRDGEIVDVDIEINATDFAVSANRESTSEIGCQNDLANVLTHEVGHLLGIDHNCWDGKGEQGVDHRGNPQPACSPSLPASLRQATMWWQQDCGETSKASIEVDDQDAMCSIYPKEEDPINCERPSLKTGGCTSLGTGPAIGLAFLLLLGARRRKTAQSLV